MDENVDVVVNPPVYRLMLEAILLLGLAVKIDEGDMMVALVLLPLLFRCDRGGGAVKVLLLLIIFVKTKSSSLGKYMNKEREKGKRKEKKEKRRQRGNENDRGLYYEQHNPQRPAHKICIVQVVCYDTPLYLINPI